MTGLSVGLKIGLVVDGSLGLAGPARAKAVISALVAFLAILAPPAMATEETVTLGGYRVSFDLGNYTGYSLEFELVPFAAVDGEEYPSSVCWIQGERTMMIAITDYGVPVEATSSLTRRAVTLFLTNAECKNLQTHEIAIDGKPAILGLGERPSGSILVCAVFWPDIQEVDGVLVAQVDCTIASEESVEVTERLLNSIKVSLPGEAEGGGWGSMSESDRMEVRSESDRILL
ncbi:hypothetical protein [Candidatus Methanocrinis natronophilus]|uniref:Uncharacterized protein n=1 Tax=Candidatus Methanocrinis natronophilus TaxID=3033396 RepID=A0ABT5XAF3_9EURY|nr:hypothetical protein [Candidatus Methanocrinis natronophilus]MDF0591651.1 hypothetical protein [Candidatus Methanocrinis natronophilus]